MPISDDTEIINSEDDNGEEMTIPYLHPNIALHDIKPNGKLFTDKQIQSLINATQKSKKKYQFPWFQPGRHSKNFVRNYLEDERLIDKSHGYVNGLLLTEDHELYAIYKGEKHARALGKGHFGKAKLAQNLKTGEWVVLKILNPHFTKGKSPKYAVDKMMRKARHEATNIRELYPDLNSTVMTHSSSGHLKAQFLLPLAKGNTILTFAKNAIMPTIKWLKLSLAMLECIQRFHQSGLFHCDLKPENMVYDPISNTVHAIDVGLSVYQDKPTIKYWHGSSFYSALEIHPDHWDGEVTFTEKTEVYALGVSIAETLGLKVRLYNESMGLISTKAYKHNIDNKKMRLELLNLLQSMVETDPEKRPTINEAIDCISLIIKHNYNDHSNILQQITKIAYVDCATLASLCKLKTKSEGAKRHYNELLHALRQADVVQLLCDEFNPFEAMKVRHLLMNKGIKVMEQAFRWSTTNEDTLNRLSAHTKLLEKQMNCLLNAFYVRTPDMNVSDPLMHHHIPGIKEINADPDLKKELDYYQKQMEHTLDLVPVAEQHLEKINTFITKRLSKLAENDPLRQSLQDFSDQINSENPHSTDYSSLLSDLKTLQEKTIHAGNRFSIFVEKKIGAVRPNTKAINTLTEEIEHDLGVRKRR